jgi:hypothetical protein
MSESAPLTPKHQPPPGYILVHNKCQTTPHQGERLRFFWRMPSKKIVLCDCRWRPDLGEHYAVAAADDDAETWRHADRAK